MRRRTVLRLVCCALALATLTAVGTASTASLIVPPSFVHTSTHPVEADPPPPEEDEGEPDGGDPDGGDPVGADPADG